MEILFLHLTYILLFIFLFQAQGMNVGISVALLEETKNTSKGEEMRSNEMQSARRSVFLDKWEDGDKQYFQSTQQ